jgi:hypothetical protein
MASAPASSRRCSRTHERRIGAAREADVRTTSPGSSQLTSGLQGHWVAAVVLGTLRNEFLVCIEAEVNRPLPAARFAVRLIEDFVQSKRARRTRRASGVAAADDDAQAARESRPRQAWAVREEVHADAVEEYGDTTRCTQGDRPGDVRGVRSHVCTTRLPDPEAVQAVSSTTRHVWRSC